MGKFTDIFKKLCTMREFSIGDAASFFDDNFKEAFKFVRYLKEIDALDKAGVSTFTITDDKKRLRKTLTCLKDMDDKLSSPENSASSVSGSEESKVKDVNYGYGLEVINPSGEMILVLVNKSDTPFEAVMKAARQFADEKPCFFGCDIKKTVNGMIDTKKSSAVMIFDSEPEQPLDWDKSIYSQLAPHKMFEVFAKHARLRAEIVLTASDDANKNKDTECYVRRGEHIRFGFYPQTLVENKYITDILSEMAKSLPFNSRFTPWKSYGYYCGDASGTPTDDFEYMWYADIELYGNKYRGVYFTENRPYFSYFERGSRFSSQADNGYKPEKMYWFLYEPLDWLVLKEKDGKAMLICDKIIDSQPCKNVMLNADSYEITPMEKYENSWQFSDIRVWLNEDFYNTAFLSYEQSVISEENIITQFDEKYCEKTKDNVFILSADEAADRNLGFNEDGTEYDYRRIKPRTDYAMCQGARSCVWMLRGTAYSSMTSSPVICDSGQMSTQEVTATDLGIVPSVILNFN